MRNLPFKELSIIFFRECILSNLAPVPFPGESGTPINPSFP